jgi:hypothetical protein
VPTEIEPPYVIARRLFEALRERFPHKYIALIQPPAVTDDRPVSGRAEPDARPSGARGIAKLPTLQQQ